MEYHWHLHDGTEGMYQDPMGRRTPLRVIKVHATMGTVEWHAGKTRSRVSLRRIVQPSYAELREFWPDVADSITQPIGLIHNGMPAFFNAIGAAIGGTK